jgi:hypothetical protein
MRYGSIDNGKLSLNLNKIKEDYLILQDKLQSKNKDDSFSEENDLNDGN